MKILFQVLAILAWPLLLPAQTNQPIRFAIVPRTSEVADVVDMLTADFSKAAKIHLLERTEIERVYREQRLSADNKDYLKLGQILGADGLLILAIDHAGTNQFLSIELVAVKPGVLLLAERFALPIEHPTQWTSAVEKLIDPLTPKLGVLAKEAVPISVLNLRSAIQSAEAREAERQLTLLAIERLSREPRLFVLERRSMQLLTSEKDLKGLDESAFWDGSYLLDGTVDNAGYSKDTITITARLIPPKGGTSASIEVSGSRTNFAEVINRLTVQVLANLKLGQSSEPWNAAEEAERFYAEAQWALKWDLFPQAQAAAESAWALGKKNSDSAGALFEAYSRSVPESWLNHDRINAQAFPDAEQFAPLARSLGILSQNATEYFSGSNSSSIPRFTAGFDAIWRAAEQLESYYYAAEARVGHEDELSGLRENMREAFKAMEAHPIASTNQSWPAQQVRQKFEFLEWQEGGACFEHPDEAIPFYRELLHRGAHPEHLPRVIGWTWTDRQRAPRLLRDLVKEVCGDTNPATRLEGLYLALLLVPDDEQGGLGRAEQDLLSAIWDNRETVFRSGENVSLVKRTEEALRDRYYEDDENKLYSRQPFASFKHKLRVDFLAHSSTTNLAVSSALFGLYGQPTETAEQARELLPLMIGYQQRLPWPRAMEMAIAHLRRVGGVPDTSTNKTVAATQPAENVVEAKFIRWDLKRPGIGPGRRPGFYGMIARNGQLWLQVHYTATNSDWPFDYKITYVAVDPQSGIKDEISFPAELDTPGNLFEVSSNALFVEAGGHLFRFAFRERTWTEIPAPMEGSTQLLWLKDHLFISRNDGLLAVQPDSKSVQLLVSTRRQPPANEVDPLWMPGTLIYAQSDGRLSALTENRCLTLDPATNRWSIRALPLGTANSYSGLRAKFSSTAGSQWLLTGPVAHHYLVGFWNDDRPCESLLMQETRFAGPAPIPDKRLQPVRWDWPKKFPLEPSDIYADDQQLWILCPRKVELPYVPASAEPLQFSDTRQATLFHFESEFRQPLSAAIHFQTGSQNAEPFNSPPGEIYRRFSRRMLDHLGNQDFWTKTPAGLIFGDPNICGHWLIPDAALQPTFDAQREELRRSSTPPSAKQANLEKP